MPSAFSSNLSLVLKYLSISRSQLAAELQVDKSIVGRWMTGAVEPSAHNLARLTAFVAGSVDGFTSLDWERSLDKLAARFGVDVEAVEAVRAPPAAPGLPLAIWDRIVAGANARGKAYEGFFKSTRPHPIMAGRYLNEYGLIRRDEIGLLRLTIGSANTHVEGWLLPIDGRLYCIATDVDNGALLFGIFHGIGAARVDVFDGLGLMPGADMGRSPTAAPMLCERVGNLSGDREADDQRYARLASNNPIAPEGSVPDHVRAHLARDFGPLQLEQGGEWLLNLPLSRTMTRGPAYEAEPTAGDPSPV